MTAAQHQRQMTAVQQTAHGPGQARLSAFQITIGAANITGIIGWALTLPGHVGQGPPQGDGTLGSAGATLVAPHSLVAGETQHPPVDLLRRYGVPMALASDANPGTSPLYLPTLIAHLGCTLFRLTPREALAGMTAHAAQALGRPELGRIQVGGPADLCLWDVGQPAELAYEVRPGRLRQRVFAGEVQHVR